MEREGLRIQRDVGCTMEQGPCGGVGDGSQSKGKGMSLKQKAGLCLPSHGGRKKGCQGRWGCGEEVEDIPIYWHCLCEMGSKGNTKKND